MKMTNNGVATTFDLVIASVFLLGFFASARVANPQEKRFEHENGGSESRMGTSATAINDTYNAQFLHDEMYVIWNGATTGLYTLRAQQERDVPYCERTGSDVHDVQQTLSFVSVHGRSPRQESDGSRYPYDQREPVLSSEAVFWQGIPVMPSIGHVDHGRTTIGNAHRYPVGEHGALGQKHDHSRCTVSVPTWTCTRSARRHMVDHEQGQGIAVMPFAEIKIDSSSRSARPNAFHLAANDLFLTSALMDDTGALAPAPC
jgi:hypothetical protein